VSEREQRLFLDSGAAPVFVVRHAVVARPTPRDFDGRRTILFVGSFSPESPNLDAVRFLLREVMPVLRSEGCDARLVVAGAGLPDHIRTADGDSVSWHADVDDLEQLYDEARVFVAPTRYAAGIPLKVIDAASRGVPVVCTPLVAEQLEWSESEVLTGDTPAEFAARVASLYRSRELWHRLREAASRRVETDYNHDVFRSALRQAVDAAVGTSVPA
jgi:glycosyltransferase involved in cell wall biosynthesis